MKIEDSAFCTYHKNTLLVSFFSLSHHQPTFGCERCNQEDYPDYQKGRGKTAEAENKLAYELRIARRLRREKGG